MQLHQLFEAKISGAKVGSAMTKIISYLERQMSFKLIKLGIEEFHNSNESGTGMRYLESGTENCIRFNWVGSSSSQIVSVDLWNGTTKSPNFNIAFNDVSLAKSLPELVNVLKNPKTGIFPVSGSANINEAKKGEFTPDSAIADMIEKMEDGRTFNRSEFVMAYHPENAYAYDAWVEKNKNKLVITGKRIAIKSGTKFGDSSEDSQGELIVTRGGKNEDYKIASLDELQKDSRVSFSESLEHLEGFTKALIKGAFNGLFVAGAGGVGKTQTVEDALAAAGLSDGQGYTKITGSASPIGIYTELYKNKDGIILFDDCDGALESQDGRNLIKAATDTKKNRKMAWAKKSAGMYDPDKEIPSASDDEDSEDGDEDEAAPETRIPNKFDFKGRIIFISNLPLDKLDPDKALRTRGYIISINPTPEELFSKMQDILYDIKLDHGSLSNKERDEILEIIKSSKNKTSISLRTLVRALGLAASGVPNFEKLIRLYS